MDLNRPTVCKGSSGWITAMSCGVVMTMTAASLTFAADAPTKPLDTSNASPAPSTAVRDFKLDPGLLGERVKVPGRNLDVPFLQPQPSEPGISRKDYLRLKDRMEERENWMFVEPGQLSEERAEREENEVLKNRWDAKEELRKKSWWEYGGKNNSSLTPLSVSKNLSPQRKEQVENELRLRLARQLQNRETNERAGKSGGRNDSQGKSGTEAAHQYGELSMKDLFSSSPDTKAGSDVGFKELFTTSGDSSGFSSRDRESSQARRQEFKDFLNISRIPKASSSDLGASPVSSSPSILGGSDFGKASQFVPKEPLGGADFSRPSSSSGFGAFTDPSRTPSYANPYSAPPPSYRSSPSREYITPQMMAPPKRRY